MNKLKFKTGAIVRLKDRTLSLESIGTIRSSLNGYCINTYIVKFANNKTIIYPEDSLQKLNEVCRTANAGEYIKIINKQNIGDFAQLYNIGDISQVIRRCTNGEVVICSSLLHPIGRLRIGEYVVLEDALEENIESDNSIDDDRELIISITDKNIIISDEDNVSYITYERNNENTLLENISDALDKYKSNININIGDIVKVVHTDSILPNDAYRLNDLNYMDKLSIVARYAYGYDPYFNDVDKLYNSYRVLEKYDDNVFLLEENIEDGRVLIVKKNGLEKVCGTEE